MCSFVDLTNVPEGGFTASEDIRCYKVLAKTRQGIYSPIMGKYYGIGQTYSVPNIVVNQQKMCCVFEFVKRKWIRKTYTSENDPLIVNYPNVKLDDGKTLVLGFEKTNLQRTGTGFYSYTSYLNNSMEFFANCVVEDGLLTVLARCVIPKGSRYYVSDDCGTYISNSLKVEEIIKKLN